MQEAVQTPDINYQPQVQGYAFSNVKPGQDKRFKKLLLIIFILIGLAVILLISLLILNYFNIITIIPNKQVDNTAAQINQSAETAKANINVTKKIPRVLNLDNNKDLTINANLRKVWNNAIEVEYLGGLYGFKIDDNVNCHLTIPDQANSTSSGKIGLVWLDCNKISNYINKDVIINFKIINNENVVISLTF